MSKYALFGVIMLWLLFATYMVNAFDTYLDDDTFSVDNPIGAIDTDSDTDIGTIRGLSTTFVSAVTLQVNGLPLIMGLIFFTVPTFILSFIAIEIIIKMLDAVIPF